MATNKIKVYRYTPALHPFEKEWGLEPLEPGAVRQEHFYEDYGGADIESIAIRPIDTEHLADFFENLKNLDEDQLWPEANYHGTTVTVDADLWSAVLALQLDDRFELLQEPPVDDDGSDEFYIIGDEH